MSRQAQAERERQARVILGESEEQIAQSFRRQARPTPTIRRRCTCGHEHAVRRAEGEGRHDHRPVQRCGHHEPGWHDGMASLAQRGNAQLPASEEQSAG